MANNSVIKRAPNYYYLELREDFIAVCEFLNQDNPPKEKDRSDPHCQALILSVMENWTNSKRNNGLDLGITMTYERWRTEIYKHYGRNTIMDSLKGLARFQLLEVFEETRVNGGHPIITYFLNYTLLNYLLDTLPPRAVNELDPQFRRNVPNGTGNVPNGTGNVPNGTGNVPNGTGNVPNGTMVRAWQRPKWDASHITQIVTQINTQINTHNRDANAPSAKDDSQKDSSQKTLFEETPPSEKPKRTRSKKAAAVEIKAPELPDLTATASVENIMLLGDYHRGSSIPKNNYDYARVASGANALINKPRAGGKKGYTLSEIHAVWNLLTGITPEDKPWLKDDEWLAKPYNVDLHVIANNIDKKLKLIAELEQKHRKVEEKKPDAPQTPKPEKLVLWTRQNDEWVATILKTRRDHVEEWENCRDHIFWEYMTAAEAQALNNGWKKYYTFSDRETRELFAAQKKRLKEQEGVLVS